MTTSLAASLRALEDSQKRITTLVQQLAKHSPNRSSRGDLSSDIHDLLKDQSDRLEILRQDVEEISSFRLSGVSKIRQSDEAEQERERNISTFNRLEEDVKISHRNFRRAQVDAKRAEDTARRQEREQLFSKRRKDEDGQLRSTKQGQKLTQDELTSNAAKDVTKSLRRTHAALESNLEQSTFAMQTLEESSQALATLGERYAGVEGLLKTSKGLVSQLYSSQKSDTWYLETAFYICVGTLSWLIFRRILYGPGWWVIWQPLKILWRLSVMLLTSVGFFSQSQNGINRDVSSPLLPNAHSRPTMNPGIPQSVELPAKGGGWNRRGETVEPDNEERVVQQIEKMIDKAEGKFAGASEEESQLDHEQKDSEPRNPKKRMMELEKEEAVLRDEL